MIIKDGQWHGSTLLQSTATLPHCDPLPVLWRLGAFFHILFSFSLPGLFPVCWQNFWKEFLPLHSRAKMFHFMQNLPKPSASQQANLLSLAIQLLMWSSQVSESREASYCVTSTTNSLLWTAKWRSCMFLLSLNSPGIQLNKLTEAPAKHHCKAGRENRQQAVNSGLICRSFFGGILWLINRAVLFHRIMWWKGEQMAVMRCL